MKITGPVRVRFAPSPTGYLHVGGARTALFNWLVARKYGGQFLLRIEDTDKARSTEASTKAIFEGLNWLGLRWDEEVVYQGSRAERHAWIAHKLIDWDYAYPCFCTKEQIAADRKAAEDRKETYVYPGTCLGLKDAKDRMNHDPYVIRFYVTKVGGSEVPHTGWDDLIHGPIDFPNKDLGGDFIILREGGSPIYNLAVVCDDIDMGITHVLRGDDHISNTPKQILLYNAIAHVLRDLEGKEVVTPQFGHMPMIFGKDGKKLSKRHGATAVGDYQGFGILEGAMLNFLALLGWSPGGDKEIMSLDEIIDSFSIERMSAKNAVFDTQKLEWMNGQYIQQMSDIALSGYLMAHYRHRANMIGLENIKQLSSLLKPRARTLNQFADMAQPFLFLTVNFDKDAVEKQWPVHRTQAAIDQLQKFGEYLRKEWVDEKSLANAINAAADGDKTAFQTLRLALIGKLESPPLADVMTLLGTITFDRIRDAIHFLEIRARKAVEPQLSGF